MPISAKLGEGLIKPSEHLPWYTGPTLLEALEQFRATPPIDGAPMRLSVQDIYRFDARRIVAGPGRGRPASPSATRWNFIPAASAAA